MRVGGSSKDGKTVTYMHGISETPDIVLYCRPTKDSFSYAHKRPYFWCDIRELYITFVTVSKGNFGVNSHCHPFRFDIAHYLLPRKPRACDRR